MVFPTVTTASPQVPFPKTTSQIIRRAIRCGSASVSAQFDLKTYWTSLIKEIDQKLDEAIPVQYPQQIYEAMRYSVLAKGAKRSPPVMCVAACEIFGGNRQAAFPTACALEMVDMIRHEYVSFEVSNLLRTRYLKPLIQKEVLPVWNKVHAASLIHDDLPCMDDDPSRRGQPSSHTKFGVDMAILAGDALFPLGFRHIVSHTPTDIIPEARLIRVIAEIARAVGSTGMAAGQFMDLEGGPNAVDFVQEKKFGEMGQCSAVCGGLLAGASDDEIQHLRRYGQAVGVLYQVVDDILEAKSGTEIKGGEKKRKAKSYVSAYGVEKAMEVAEDLKSQAKRALDGFEKYGERVLPLYSFVDYAADRGFSIGESV